MDKNERISPTVGILQRKNEIEHHSIPYQEINDSKSDIPSKLPNVNFSLNTNHNQHGAPSSSFNDQRNYLQEKL